MKTVRAKFEVYSSTNYGNGDKEIVAQAVMGNGSEENKSFAKYTPNGKLVMTIGSGTEAQDFFTPGKKFYLDFTEAEAE